MENDQDAPDEEHPNNNNDATQPVVVPYDRCNAACVEGGACVGGFCFLIGTIVFAIGPDQGDDHCTTGRCTNYQVVLALWTLGSAAFLFGGLALSVRHAVMKIT